MSNSPMAATRGGIRDLTLTIPAGEKIGIVGASGAGKTTLVGLLLRLYDVERGTIRIDGHDLRDVTQESLRRQVVRWHPGHVPLFKPIRRDNIRVRSPRRTQDEVVAAAKAVRAA